MSAAGEAHAVGRVSSCPGLLAAFNHAGVLAPADVHVALRLACLGGERDETVMLAAALAVRAPRLGHVHVDLDGVRDSAAVESEAEGVDVGALPWPEVEGWLAAVAASPLSAVGEAGGEVAPLRLIGARLYLERYWREERELAQRLRAMCVPAALPVDLERLAEGLGRLFEDERRGRQGLAAAAAVLRRLSVIAGGPGTGKTTTVARVIALLAEQAIAAGMPPPRVALAAPTGKAAARLQEAVGAEASALAVSAQVGALLGSLEACTLHRLLGSRPDSHSRFCHDRTRRLPHDVVIVDETSMVSLSLMARLVEAVRPEARLVLLGDPGQLVSIEAGAVLADIVGPAGARLMLGDRAREALERAVGAPVDADRPPAGVAVGDGIVVLDRVHRYGGAIAALAEAIRAGEEDEVIALLGGTAGELSWVPVDVAEDGAAEAIQPLRAGVIQSARALVRAAAAGDACGALGALAAFRLLCAHRHGPYGVSTWTARIERWLAEELDGFVPEETWYVGRPLLVTRNDYELRLHNGELGVIVRADSGRPLAAFSVGAQIVTHSPTRLSAVETVHAMTIHKSQGSQFDVAAVLLPAPSSRILSRQLLYTAVTRARRRLILVGSEETVRAAVRRPAARASGLRERLWAPEPLLQPLQ